MSTPYVHSGYERKEHDDYQTIDGRCVDALVDSLSILDPPFVDMCGRFGSGITDRLRAKGFDARNLNDAFTDDIPYCWITTNPPYDRKIVDTFTRRAIHLIEEEKVAGACFLMRANWDFAVSRKNLFDTGTYYGQVRMRFRPWWSEERKAQPIHNYVWHVWTNPRHLHPVIHYWPK
jgi:hypothetical protein